MICKKKYIEHTKLTSLTASFVKAVILIIKNEFLKIAKSCPFYVNDELKAGSIKYEFIFFFHKLYTHGSYKQWPYYLCIETI